MWRLWNKLFGWEYVVIPWAFSDTKVVRVRYTQDGVPYLKVYDRILTLDVKEPILWLTKSKNGA